MSTTSVSDVLAERTAARLRLYRDCVARVARGDGVGREQADDLRRAMYALGLPSFAFNRDVRVWATSSTARGYRRAELEIMHPQLFVPVDEWVRDRVSAMARRGSRPCPR
jgi:hypothetical protein